LVHIHGYVVVARAGARYRHKAGRENHIVQFALRRVSRPGLRFGEML
jgi:hypothetical protein